MVVAVLSFAAGLILDTVTRGRREIKLLAYLGHKAVEERRGTRARLTAMREIVRTNDPC